MKLLSTLTAFPPSLGGAQLHHHQLSLRLAIGHDVQIASHWDENRTDWLLGTTLRSPEMGSDYVYEGIPVHLIGLSRSQKRSMVPSVLTYYLAMDQAVERIGDVLADQIRPLASDADLIHNVRIGRAGLSKASLLLAHQQDIPFVITPVHHPRWSGWRYRVYQDIYCEADAVIALTAAEKSMLMDIGGRAERVFVTGIGPLLSNKQDGDSFRRVHDLEGPIILFLGQHYAYKGYLQLLQATEQVWENIPDAHFVFIGPAVGNSEKHFRNYQDRRVLRLGAVGLQEKTDTLAACDILCVPSTQESFGGVYTEAWSFSKPVIGCPIPAVREVVADGEDGVLVNQDAPEIADRITYLLSHPEQARKLGEAGKKKVLNRYTWDRIAKLTEQVYMKILGKQQPVDKYGHDAD